MHWINCCAYPISSSTFHAIDHVLVGGITFMLQLWCVAPPSPNSNRNHSLNTEEDFFGRLSYPDYCDHAIRIGHVLVGGTTFMLQLWRENAYTCPAVPTTGSSTPRSSSSTSVDHLWRE
uniref:Uncharacterized protein n=1 Tax=Arundo donax TaxID=35708 RepID=A0A0A9BBK4_ARUDO